VTITVILHTSDRRPKWICNVCQEAAFAEDEHRQFERHVVRCAAAHEERLREMSLRHKAPFLFDPQNEDARDVDHEAWVKEHRSEVLEGRKKL
jgi:hypothetical protein